MALSTSKPKALVTEYLEKLKSKNEESRHKAWIGLKSYVASDLSEENKDQIQNFLNQLNSEIEKMRNVADINSKKGAILAIDVALNVDVAHLSKTISRSENHLKEILSKETDLVLLQMAASLLGQLALRAGQYGSNIVDFQCNKAIEELSSERNEKNESRRLASVFILRELALCTPTLFYQSIKKFFEVIFKAIRDPKPIVRIHAAGALRAALAIVAQRENQEADWYQSCFDNCTEFLEQSYEKVKLTKEDWSHGTLLIYEELMRFSNIDAEKRYEEVFSIMERQSSYERLTSKIVSTPRKLSIPFMNPTKARFSSSASEAPNLVRNEMTQHKDSLYESTACRKYMSNYFSDVCKAVFSHRNNRNVYIQQSVVNLIPRLASFNPQEFIRKGLLKQSVAYLITLLKRERERNPLFLAVGLLCLAAGKEARPHLDDVLDVVSNCLPKDLQQRKQKINVVEPAVFTCISLLAKAMGNDIQLKMRELIGPMLHVPLSPSLTAALEDIAKQIPSLRRDIQDGLLQMLSLILTGKPPTHPGAPRLAIQSAGVYDSAGVSPDITNISLALQTLGTFDFEGHSLTKLLRHCADNFLSSDNEEIRLEATKTCCSLLSHISSMSSVQLPLVHTVADVLGKVLITGITDTEPEIRCCVFKSLDSQFDSHLAQAENLASLFIALNDEVPEIRSLAMVMIGRLSSKNPAYVMPSLRKILIQLMAVLEHSSICRDREQAANMLFLLVQNARRIVMPYLDSIVDVLMCKLKDQGQSTGVITSVLEALGGVAEVGGQKMLKYADDLLPIIASMLEDSTSTYKREVVVKTLGLIIASTGLVVTPYNQFPNLLPILLNLLDTELELSARKEVIRLLGLLGALDPYQYKVNMGKISGKEAAGAVALSMWEPTKDKYERTDLPTNEMFVAMSPSLEDFYPATAIACMMKIINDPSLSSYHLQAVSAINFIFNSLGSKSVQYLQQVVPACLKVMKENQSVREFLFTQLSNVISIVKLHIKPYLADIFSIVRITWSSSLENPDQSEGIQKTMICLLKTTVTAIATELKLYLPDVIPHMLKVFVCDKSERRTVIKELLEAIQLFGINLDGYVHLLLPPIMQLLDQSGVSDEVKELALKTVESLTDTLDLSDFASEIIHPLVRLLDTYPERTQELTKQAMNTLCALAAQLGKKYRIFVQMVHKVLQRHKITDVKYNSLVRDIVEDSLYMPALKAIRAAVPQAPEIDTSASAKRKAIFAKWYEPILEICKVTRSSKEDWMEWLRRFMFEVLRCSPDPSLRACQILAQSYQNVARELFNPAFVSCWTELPDQPRKELITYIENVLKEQTIPEITQALLNLAEFMEICDSKNALPIRPMLLGKQAIESRAYAKALHYVEEEFHEYVKAEREVMTKAPQSEGMRLMEKLISVNNKLQQPEAAHGVLLYAKKKTSEGSSSRDGVQLILPGGKIPGRFYEMLHQWAEARRVYEEELVMEGKIIKELKIEASRIPAEQRKLEEKLKKRQEVTLGRMRCLEELGEWAVIQESLNSEDVCSWTKASEELRQTMSRMAAASAWGLETSDNCVPDFMGQMTMYVNYIPKDSFDGLFYRAVLKTMQPEGSNFFEAHELIAKARDLLSTELASLSLESYSRAYGAMVNVQMLTELEEVIQYKLVEQQRDCIRDMWWKRMNGCQRTVEDWYKLLRLHSLVLTPIEDAQAHIKFSALCRRNGRMARSHEVLSKLEDLKNASGSSVPSDVHLKIGMARLKHDWEVTKVKNPSIQALEKFIKDYSHSLSHLKSQPGSKGRSLLAKCYLLLGSWTEITYGYTTEKIADILSHYKEALKQDNKWHKAWHAYAYTNYEAVLLYKSMNQESPPSGSPDSTLRPADNLTTAAMSASSRVNSPREDYVYRFCLDAIEGFLKSISLSEDNSLQDTLRLLTLWFDYGEDVRVYDCLIKGLKTIKIENWLQVIPQLIARIDTNRQKVGKLIQILLCDISKNHPQALIYPLTVAAKSSVAQRRDAAQNILNKMEEHSPKLVAQAKLVSEELIRVAILWHELWHEGLEEASRLYFGDKNVKGMFETLEPLHQMLERGPQTAQEVSFQTTYGTELTEALSWCRKYQRTGNVKELTKAWDSYYHVFRRISKQLPMLTSLDLQLVSPKLLEARDLELAVPGTYDTKEVIGIHHVQSSMQIITSKQRPRKLSIYGSNGKEYQFLLKGHEDLRQDERVMQLFGLVNSLLLANTDTCRMNLTIQRYSAIPLSTNSGLLGWVPHCDTLHSLIRDYRDKKKILLNIEHRIMMRMANDYEHLTLMQKVEVFENALENTAGDDLAKIIWYKSPKSEVWFERRTNYTRSLAVMSMVGYVLGLGDRHPSNLMLDRESGKIIHIDFGDCFEVAMSREKFPEKIPFRLTRMLINAMEVTGIDGNYRMTCERVMKVLRSNKDSVMAVLEAFVYDPLLNWWLMEGKAIKQAKLEQNRSSGAESSADDLDIEARMSSLTSSKVILPTVSEASFNQHQGEVVNQKALKIVQRVKDKLTGKDFSTVNGEESVGVERQIELLIEQATSHANLCQCYIGWCPFW